MSFVDFRQKRPSSVRRQFVDSWYGVKMAEGFFDEFFSEAILNSRFCITFISRSMLRSMTSFE